MRKQVCALAGVLSVLPLIVVSGEQGLRPSDRWSFNAEGDPVTKYHAFTSVQNGQRYVDLDERAIGGVPAVVAQGLWCQPGASGKIGSAMILPKTGDFTLSFYAGFPETLRGEQKILDNGRMLILVDAAGRLAVRFGGATAAATTAAADGRWHQFGVMRRKGAVSVWIDGHQEGEGPATSADVFGPELVQWRLFSSENRNRMFFDELIVFPNALPDATMVALAKRCEGVAAPRVTPEDEALSLRRARSVDPEFADESDYAPLKVVDGQLRTFAEQHDVFAVAVPWDDPAGRDLLCAGSIFGSRPLRYRFLRVERGVPVYAQGVPYEGPAIGGSAVWKYGTSEFSLCRDEDSRLVEYRRNAKGFGPARSVCRTDGKPVVFSRARFAFADVDGDGVDDLVETFFNYGRAGSAGPCEGFPWPEPHPNPWTDVETPYSGVGRGYDVFGNWMGTEIIAEVHWSKGVRTADGSPRFEARRPVYVDMPEYPGILRKLTWKLYMGIVGAATFEADSGRYLALYGDMNRLAAFRIRVVGGDVFCGRPRPMLKDGYETPHCYWIHGLTMLDVDGDGRKEMLVDGNPGTIAVLKGGEPGTWTSARAFIEGGDVCGETLSSVARIDWDGDGLPDLVMGDASGWLTFWRGTKDPRVYEAARPFTVDGKPYCRKAGDSGSLQGKPEKIWGYVKVAAGLWGSEKALVTVDITGNLLLHTRAGADMLELKTRPFRRANGVPLKVGWRSRVDFAPTGFAGAERPSLLLQDLENDLVVATPETEGSLTLSTFRKLRYADGSTVRPSGINGLSGRAHTSLVDWDGDGAMDIVFGNNASSQRFIEKTVRRRTGSSFYVLQNVGSDAEPKFAEAVPMILRKNGKRLNFGWHNATPWVTDLNGDGKLDLLVSAENGKVYAFDHDEVDIGFAVEGAK